MIYIIGSGPAGIAAAVPLLQSGRDVTMLDAGIELEPERQRIVAALQDQPYEQWDRTSLERLKEGMTPNAKGIPLKMIYGSDFPYQAADQYLPLEQRPGVATASSLALGGFSNVWGAVLLPYRAEDIGTWPIGINDLAEHYAAVLSFMDLSAREDDLAAIFPLYRENPCSFDPSPQAVALLRDMAEHREPLRAQGVRFGTSRLAVRAEVGNGQRGCAYCGMCMYGCPYGLIYNSAFTLRRLQQDGRFTYVRNVVVERLQETNGGVLITGKNRLTRQAVSFRGDRALLGCGTLATTRILLESLEAYDHPLQLLDSQYFLFPLLRYRKTGQPRSDRLHALAQVFLEILDPAVSPYTVHLQTYTYNDLYLGAMKSVFGPAYHLLKPFVHAAVDRMLVMQGYLHSDHSPAMAVTLRRPVGAKPGQLVLERRPAAAPSEQVVRRVVKKVGSCRKHLRALPLGMMLQVAPAGRGFHGGGTFPMRRAPRAHESDVLGRPSGFQRVHVIDATTFPTIPATTITFSVMANAHRIADGIAND